MVQLWRKVINKRTIVRTAAIAAYDGLDTVCQDVFLVGTNLSIEKARLKVKKKYVPRFKKVLPPKKVVRFFQVDNKLDAVVKMEMARNIPLVQ